MMLKQNFTCKKIKQNIHAPTKKGNRFEDTSIINTRLILTVPIAGTKWRIYLNTAHPCLLLHTIICPCPTQPPLINQFVMPFRWHPVEDTLENIMREGKANLWEGRGRQVGGPQRGDEEKET